MTVAARTIRIVACTTGRAPTRGIRHELCGPHRRGKMNMALIVCGGILAFVAILGAGLVLFAMYIRRRVEAAVPALGRFVQVGDSRLHIVERGSGPTLVLVHGLGAQLRNFYALVEHLAPNFHVICVDGPGCGYSTRPAHWAWSALV